MSFRTEVDCKTPVRKKAPSWAYFNFLVEQKRMEGETEVKLPAPCPDPDKFIMEVWLPRLIGEKEEAARGQTGQDSKAGRLETSSR
ncbi:hypothetical protein RvY_12892 [Ramazzottius varieornatus]|uniref:Uncharacterized protein n=1 Tax=Ramazzottius varieornatus TaxID=947166 RepID=A0A1D1VL18_RAMVA|nr:hypothetical protein RvY_12892 [Ramazzottius varieornatus]